MEDKSKKEPISFWSCDPKDIKPWTEEDKKRLNITLNKIFGKQLKLDDSKPENK